MKMFKIVGSHLCPNTLYSIVKCKEAGVSFVFRDLSASLDGLKEFLSLHEHDQVYQLFRGQSGKENYLSEGKIGLPCFVFDDGYKTLDLQEALERAKEENGEN